MYISCINHYQILLSCSASLGPRPFSRTFLLACQLCEAVTTRMWIGLKQRKSYPLQFLLCFFLNPANSLQRQPVPAVHPAEHLAVKFGRHPLAVLKIKFHCKISHPTPIPYIGQPIFDDGLEAEHFEFDGDQLVDAHDRHAVVLPRLEQWSTASCRRAERRRVSVFADVSRVQKFFAGDVDVHDLPLAQLLRRQIEGLK